MSIQGALFRQVAGSFATGVTIVMTGRGGEFRGLTASSFTSLSLDPQLVLVCLDREANSLPVLRETGHFSINILGTDQQGLSQKFASKSLSAHEKMIDVEYRLASSGIPVLSEAIAFFECRMALEYEGGDHVILVGEVIDGGLGSESPPLVYFRGGYQSP